MAPPSPLPLQPAPCSAPCLPAAAAAAGIHSRRPPPHSSSHRRRSNRRRRSSLSLLFGAHKRSSCGTAK